MESGGYFSSDSAMEQPMDCDKRCLHRDDPTTADCRGCEGKKPAVASAGPTSDPRVDDLAMLVKRLAHSLEKVSPDSDLPGKAIDYLKRKGLQGSPLRQGDNAPDSVQPFDYSPFTPPFEFYCGKILDSNGRNILDVRGWGFLTGTGGAHLHPDKACAIQDNLGRRIAELMTQDAKGGEQ